MDGEEDVEGRGGNEIKILVIGRYKLYTYRVIMIWLTGIK